MSLKINHLYTDGACSGNPGPGGWAYVLVNADQKQVSEAGGFEPQTTNNRMELLGVIEGLIAARAQKIQELLILSDSTYVIRGFTQWRFGWKKRGWVNQENEPVSNQDLWKELDRVAEGFKLQWKYVRGHQGTPGNERVDEIAVSFSQGQSLHIYHKSTIEKYIFDVTEIPEGEPLPEMKFNKPSPSKSAFYVSYVNGVLTRHSDWGSCERTVKGQSKAQYKKVTSEAELQQVLKKWGVNGN